MTQLLMQNDANIAVAKPLYRVKDSVAGTDPTSFSVKPKVREISVVSRSMSAHSTLHTGEADPHGPLWTNF